MFKLLVISSLVATALAGVLVPVATKANPEALAYIILNDGLSHSGLDYGYHVKTSNGISQNEAGIGSHDAKGEYSYTGPDGVEYKVTYVADENGFHPEGAHLPKAPATPAHVIESLKQIRANPDKDTDIAALDATIERLSANVE
jgi:hypothetical protein